MIIVGGANGSGKTTFVKKYLEQNPGVTYLSADLIAEELSPNDLSAAKIKAGRVFKSRMISCINKKENFLVESTLSGSSLLRYINKANINGFETQVLYVFHDSLDVCINRVRERVLHGGHDVPKHDIIRRYKRSLHNFWHSYKNSVDSWHLMYNSNVGFDLIASGKKELEINILDNKLYNIFEEITHEQR